MCVIKNCLTAIRSLYALLAISDNSYLLKIVKIIICRSFSTHVKMCSYFKYYKYCKLFEYALTMATKIINYPPINYRDIFKTGKPPIPTVPLAEYSYVRSINGESRDSSEWAFVCSTNSLCKWTGLDWTLYYKLKMTIVRNSKIALNESGSSWCLLLPIFFQWFLLIFTYNNYYTHTSAQSLFMIIN